MLFRVVKPYYIILELENELKPQLIFKAAYSHSIQHRLLSGCNTDHVFHLVAKEIKSSYETLVRFGIPYVKIMYVRKSVAARLIMPAAHSHTLVTK